MKPLARTCDYTAYRQFLRFAQVGVVGFIVNAGLVEALNSTMGPIWAQTIAFPIAVTVTWSLNRRYTFVTSGFSHYQEWVRYVFANSIGWLVNNGSYIVLVLSCPFAHDYPAIAVAVGSIAGLFFNFSMSRFFVFRR